MIIFLILVDAGLGAAGVINPAVAILLGIVLAFIRIMNYAVDHDIDTPLG